MNRKSEESKESEREGERGVDTNTTSSSSSSSPFVSSRPPFAPIPHSSEWQSPHFLTRRFLFTYSLGLAKKGVVEQSGDVGDNTVVILFLSLRCTVATCAPLIPTPSPARCHGLFAPTYTGSSQPLSLWNHSRLPLLLLHNPSISHLLQKKNNVVVPLFTNILGVSKLSIFRHRPLLVL